jgi:cell division protein FtsQ
MNRKVNVSENELLSKVSVKIVNPHTVKVAVEENTLVGCVKSGNQYYYLDENGAIILSQAEKLTEVPILEDLKIQTTETGDYLETTDMALLESLLDIATKLTDYGVASDSISVTEEGMYVAKMGKVTIQLGYNKNIDEKISELKDLLPELDGLSGILHLEDYDSTKDSIIFEKDS